MRLHESHDEGGFGVPNNKLNTISRHVAAYTTNARFVAFLGTFARPAQEVHEAYKRRQGALPASSTSQDQQPLRLALSHRNGVSRGSSPHTGLH